MRSISATTSTCCSTWEPTRFGWVSHDRCRFRCRSLYANIREICNSRHRSNGRRHQSREQRWSIDYSSSRTAASGEEYPVAEGNRAKYGDNLRSAVSVKVISEVVPKLTNTGWYHHSYLRVQALDMTPRIIKAISLTSYVVSPWLMSDSKRNITFTSGRHD